MLFKKVMRSNIIELYVNLRSKVKPSCEFAKMWVWELLLKIIQVSSRLIITEIVVQDFTKVTDHFRGTYGIDLNFVKKIWKNTTRKLIGLGNTEILIKYAQNNPQTLLKEWGQTLKNQLSSLSYQERCIKQILRRPIQESRRWVPWEIPILDPNFSQSFLYWKKRSKKSHHLSNLSSYTREPNKLLSSVV
jgi:hypothetical protein